MKTHWDSRPPATARVARKIWDLLTLHQGEEPDKLWHNWNGIVWGRQMSDADYGAWKQAGGVSGWGEDVDEFIVIMAGGRQGGLPLRDWYAKFNPKALELYDKQIADFKRRMTSNQSIKEARKELQATPVRELRELFARDDDLKTNYPHWRFMIKAERITALLGRQFPNDDID